MHLKDYLICRPPKIFHNKSQIQQIEKNLLNYLFKRDKKNHGRIKNIIKTINFKMSIKKDLQEVF